MLERLHVRNYVLIDSLDIDFPEGLIIITGQTGAGKSIILGALSLALGAKSDASVIGASADNCVVEAEFIAPDSLRSVLEDNDIDWDEGRVVIRRVVNKTGRSRSFLNDSPVSVQLLSSIASSLIDIHSQHQTLMLSEPRFRMSVLDHFAGAEKWSEECAAAYKEWQSLKAELEAVENDIRNAEAEKDYDYAVFSALDAACLRDGELEELETEQKQLENAEEIKSNLYAVENLFNGDGPEDSSMSIDRLLRESQKHLDKIAAFVPDAASLSERIASCRVELDDTLSEISSVNGSVEVSEERLREVDERLSLLYGLLTKHSCREISELIAIRESVGGRLHDSSLLIDKREFLAGEMDKSRSRLEAAADALHKARAEAAPSFASAIQNSLRFLELETAVFAVDLQDAPLSPSGRDAVVFLFSANSKTPSDVSKCASGGELSRIMLSLKSMMARFTKMPTMIFDEIDTGVSGSVADKMGRMICDMGAFMQVFAITHLPQVAAKGNAHYLVSKETVPSGGNIVTSIKRLNDEQRVLEVARMLSGSSLTDAAIANAKSLLNN